MTGRYQQEIACYGALLRQYRMSADISQEALAERVGVSTRAGNDLECGLKTRPQPATLHALELDSDARGPGRHGNTRLVLELARVMATDFPDSIVLII